MGIVKDRMIYEEGRGWGDGPKRHVCAKCVNDEYLAEHINDEASAPLCDYCGRKGKKGTPIAAPVDVLLEAVGPAIYHYWTDPAAELPYESAEGGYQGEVIDSTEDLLAQHVGVEWPEELIADVAACFTNEVWCKRHYFTLDADDRLIFGWRDFEKATKHKSRYASLLPPVEEDHAWLHADRVPTSAMLDEVAETIRTCGLYLRLVEGTRLVRARPHAVSTVLKSAADLGAPTPEQAKFASRMSAAGIAVFYGAFEARTAIVETFDPADARRRMVTTARFRTVRQLEVLNLCDLPAIPSYFDVERSHLREAISFLQEFVAAVARRTDKDGNEHIEYVPTQIFAEYVRHRFRKEGGGSLDGIIYPSAQVPGGRNCVLFCDQSNCGVPSSNEWERVEHWLSLVERSVRRVGRAACKAAWISAAKSRARRRGRTRRGTV